jgi:adenine-specific DNA-methyltransferase
MDKLRMQTANKADDNFKKLAAMFPNAVTETINESGEVVRAIDKDVLMQEISCKVVDGNEERYQFTWPDKKKSVLLANAPINKTLRPVREDETVPTGADSEGKPYCSTGSVDFDTTENLYIEGDNLEVLKLLQETYLGKIKMIYIDPPYNTGNDFVYEDDFAQSTDEYLANSGQYDEDGNRMVQNTESNGRFHTDWLNMIYPRLRLTKDLLTDDGVVFISIDENEMENLRKVCDEIFGESNFIGQFVWQRRTSPDMRKLVSTAHDYIVTYGKNTENLSNAINKVRLTEKDTSNYSNPDNDPRGPWASSDFTAQGFRPNQMYEIVTPGGAKYTPPEGRCWKNIESEFLKQCAEGRMWFGRDGMGIPRRKTYLSEREGKNVWTWWPNSEVGHSQEATQEVKNLFDGHAYFDYPKPVRLLKKIIQIGTHEDSLVLDFFSGSATTAHAVMQLNAEDGGHRKFIMVQLPEATDEKSEAYKAGYQNICEIGKERIRRAGTKINNENEKLKDVPLLKDNKDVQLFLSIAENGHDAIERTKSAFERVDISHSLDTGFRVLKCDTSNMKDVYYNPAEYEVNMFSRLEDNIKEDRTPEDLLFQVMLDLGVLLSSKIEETTIAGKKVFNVEDNYLIACFDSDVSEETIKAIAKQKPYYFVMRDSSMASDSVATNFDQIFATYSPDTVRKVL